MNKISKLTYQQILMQLIIKWSSPNAFSTLSCVCWISSLDDKGLDVAMKCAVVVIVGCTQGKEVLNAMRLLN
jgi:hypothetical protein